MTDTATMTSVPISSISSSQVDVSTDGGFGVWLLRWGAQLQEGAVLTYDPAGNPTWFRFWGCTQAVMSTCEVERLENDGVIDPNGFVKIGSVPSTPYRIVTIVRSSLLTYFDVLIDYRYLTRSEAVAQFPTVTK